MLFSYDRPTDVACALEGTATWLSSDQGVYLTNGRPNVKTRLSWPTEAQTNTSEAVIDVTWTSPISPRVVALLGVSLPLGLKVTVDFRQGGTWGHDSQTTSVRLMSNNTNGVVIALPASVSASDGMKVHLVNNVSGAAVVAAGASVDIGELWVGSSADWIVQRTVKDDYTDPTERRRTLGQQIFATPRLPYRKLSLDIYPAEESAVDQTRIMRALSSQSVSCVVILQTSALDATLFGNVTGFSLSTLSSGAYWQPSVSFEEVPNG